VSRPPTPNLDRLVEVSAVSNVAGEFAVDFLRERGIFWAEWREIRSPCFKRTVYRGGEPISHTDDPYGCDCAPRDGLATPHTRRELTIVPREAVIERLLAEFFGLDYAALEPERASLLAYQRELNGRVS
jgi:hypothetical protein